MGASDRALAQSATKPAKSTIEAVVHSDSSQALPKKFVVVTAYYEQISASAIGGTPAFANAIERRAPLTTP